MNLPMRSINPGTSLWLDLLRISAALLVVVFHAHDQWFSTLSPALSRAGHASVIVFFVLSGYVIAYTTARNQRGFRSYLQARLSRLYSVVFPALVITAIIGFLVAHLSPALSAEYSRGASLPRYFLAGTFLNEVWFLSAAPPLNRPLWSLGFEFWYYAIFGFWFFKKPGWKNAILPILACLIAGPKILLMMPIWLMGCAAFHYAPPTLTIPRAAWWITVGTLFSAVGIFTLPQMPYALGLQPFFFANQFLTDWLVGIGVAATLWILPQATKNLAEVPWIKTVRTLADLTFPIYVLHHPLLVLFRALVPYQNGNGWQMFQAVTAALLVAAAVGFFLERQRPVWTKLFKRIL